MSKLLFIILISMTLISSGAYAMSIGSLVKGDIASVAANQSAKFTILFWNADNDSYTVSLNGEVPEDWIIIISQKDVVLSSSIGSEYIKLPYKEEPIRAVPVDVIVKPPYFSKPGKYNVTVTAEANIPNSDIGFSQERVFNLVVQVMNPLFSENQSKSAETPMTNQSSPTDASQPLSTSQQDNSWIYFLLVAIAVMSFLIYKYS